MYKRQEGDRGVSAFKELLPFNKKVNERFVKRSHEVAKATILGQVAVGAIQGIIAGIFFYLFKAPSPLLFLMIAILLGILPFVGPWLVIVPVGLIMIATGNYLNGLLLMGIGVGVCSVIDDILRPIIVGKKAKINPVIVFVGMLGGLALLGPIGLIVGPLILEYMIIFVDLYRNVTKD